MNEVASRYCEHEVFVCGWLWSWEGKVIFFKKRHYHVWENFAICSHNRNQLLCTTIVTSVSHETGVFVLLFEFKLSNVQRIYTNVHWPVSSTIYWCILFLVDDWEGESMYFLCLLREYCINEVGGSFSKWQVFLQGTICLPKSCLPGVSFREQILCRFAHSQVTFCRYEQAVVFLNK